jgi:hypothetical protein
LKQISAGNLPVYKNIPYTKQPAMKKKISRKLELKKTTLTSFKGGDSDTPTVNDNCDHGSILGCFFKTIQNTYCVCNPADWCGYNHETNCAGPLLSGFAQ